MAVGEGNGPPPPPPLSAPDDGSMATVKSGAPVPPSPPPRSFSGNDGASMLSVPESSVGNGAKAHSATVAEGQRINGSGEASPIQEKMAAVLGETGPLPPPPPPPRRQLQAPDVADGSQGQERGVAPPPPPRKQSPSRESPSGGPAGRAPPPPPPRKIATADSDPAAPKGVDSATPPGQSLQPPPLTISEHDFAERNTSGRPERSSPGAPPPVDMPPYSPRGPMMGRGGRPDFSHRGGRGGVHGPPGRSHMMGRPPFLGDHQGHPGMPPPMQGAQHSPRGGQSWTPPYFDGPAPGSSGGPSLLPPAPPAPPGVPTSVSSPRPPGVPPRPPLLPPPPPPPGVGSTSGTPPVPPMVPPGAPPLPPGAPPLPPGPPPSAPAFADDGNFLAKMLKEQEEEERKKQLQKEEDAKKKAEEDARLEKERQAHAKRVAAENKRTRRFALGGGFGGRSRAARPKMGNSRGMVVKAFAADSDDEEESDEDDTSKGASGTPNDAPSQGGYTAAAATTSLAGGAAGASSDAAAEGSGEGQVGLGAAVALSEAASTGTDLTEDTKIMIRQTAEWFHANPEKSKIILEKSRGNAKFSFLFDASTAEGRFYRQVLEEIKTEEEVKRVCSGFGDANASNYGPTPTDSGNVYGPGAGLAAAAAVAASAAAGAVGAAGAPGAGTPSWAGAGPSTAGSGERGGAGANAAQIVAQISAQVVARSAATPGGTTAGTTGRPRKNRWDAGAGGATLPTAPPASGGGAGLGATAAQRLAAAKLVAEAAAAAGSGASASAPAESALGKRGRGFSEGDSDGVAKSGGSLALPETMDAGQAEQLRQQKEMQRLEARMREAAARQAMPGAGTGKVEGEAERRMRELYEERLKEYGELAAVEDEKGEDERDTVEDAEATGGVIDGGTWEHRKRAKEMLKTAEGALSLTLQAKGAHHMGQYLPKEELDRFLKKSSKAAKGEALEIEEDFEKNKLDSDNIGFQMLKKAGWKEGQGLGKEGEGTAAPVNMAAGAEGAGVGVKETHEVAEGDNEFEQYRKRMMLAYRFRPNPLNNPRRSYY